MEYFMEIEDGYNYYRNISISRYLLCEENMHVFNACRESFLTMCFYRL